LIFLIEEGSKWVITQRNKYLPQAVPLSSQEKEKLHKWFDPAVINAAKIVQVPVIEKPLFYDRAQTMELYNLPDLTQMDSLVFGEVIAVSQKYKPSPDSTAWHGLLFKSLVRVTLFRLLKARKLIDFYVNEWMKNGFNFDMISLEVVAEELQRRFEGYPDIVFSVEEELKEYIKDLYRNQ